MTGVLAGKCALVTGGASGIGRATAVALAGEGAAVVIADIAPTDVSERVCAELRSYGGTASSSRTDVADESAVLALFKMIAAEVGQLDILINNAGILIEKPLVETTGADFDRQMGVNLRGAFLVGREALRMMASRRSGRVINVASELAYLGRENCSLYCASKGAILSMTRSWAREFAPDILVNALAPGPTDTPLLGPGSTSPETLAKEAANPLGRIAQPEEIAAAALFLAGPGASFMTGQCVSPNGGAVMF
jgi:3-oxoacyl-[acyl-carrier protein] reductase